MQKHSLTRTAVGKTGRRVGRGGKRGKMSGRGHKGQTARAGNSTRPEMREQIKKLPKLRGHGVNRAATVNAERKLALPVNISVLEANFETGTVITPAVLVKSNVVKARGKKLPLIKILGNGELTKKFTIQNCSVSVSAKTKIEKAGGEVS